MKTSVAATLLLVAGAQAFSSQSLPVTRESSTVVYWNGMMGGGSEYIPDGFTKESYKKFKEEEAAKKQANLGRMGPRGFQSRSMQAFQEAMERGEAEHLMPVFNAEERIRKGELKKEDIPYMQRGGSWDNSDIKGAKKKAWSSRDKEYSSGGFKKEQSVSIFGYGEGLDWTGSKARQGPPETVVAAAPVFGKNYKAPNVYAMKGVKVEKEEPKKKFFGLF